MDLNEKCEETSKQDSESTTPLDIPSEESAPPVQHPKIASILLACESKDSETLRALATSEGGLVSDAVRRQACKCCAGLDLRANADKISGPILLGSGIDTGPASSNQGEKGSSWRSLPRHRDEDQVQLDVNRSFIYYPKSKFSGRTPSQDQANQKQGETSKQLDVRKEELSDLITEVLRRHPYLYYFQGYHDICQVFLLVLSTPQRAPAVARLSSLRIRDFMLPILAPAVAQLLLIPGILHAANPSLAAHLSAVGEPFFALSGTLTMYAHDIQEYGDISRLFDVLLAREAVFSVYMFAQIVLQRSQELFDTPADEPEMLHSILSKLPKPLDLEALIRNTSKLFAKYPPESLREWRQISSFSVLKTARDADQAAKQTLEEGQQYFEKQVEEINREEQRKRMLNAIWEYRKPAGGVVLAILVGVASVYIASRRR
jgi:hypothetical protein